MQIDRDRSRLDRNDEAIEYRIVTNKERHLEPGWAKKGPPDGNRVFWEEIESHWGADGN